MDLQVYSDSITVTTSNPCFGKSGNLPLDCSSQGTEMDFYIYFTINVFAYEVKHVISS